jgi:ElaB/YqjD/DUF883 family membrane-anchored ribosome-binding protein
MATAAKGKDKSKTLEQANETIDALASRAKEALQSASKGADQARGSIEGVWRVAEKARAQASDLADEVVARGQDTVRAVGERVEAQPYVALGIVGLFGVLLGYMLRGR